MRVPSHIHGHPSAIAAIAATYLALKPVIAVIITKGLIYVLARVLVSIISKKRGFENRCTKSAGLSR